MFRHLSNDKCTLYYLDDEEDDDIKPKAVPKVKPSAPKPATSLFGDDKDDDSFSFSPQKPKSGGKSSPAKKNDLDDSGKTTV